MAENIQIASFEGGALTVHTTGEKSREAVLALPLNRLLVKVFRVPVETVDLQSLSPYPDEPLTVSCETLQETEDAKIVLAAALPESAADDLATALDEAKLNITRVDALELGQLRKILSQVIQGEPEQRRLLLLKGVDNTSLFVLDDHVLVTIRALSHEADLVREIMLSLLEAEDCAGAKPLAEVLTAGDFVDDVLSGFAPVRKVEASAEDAIQGVLARSQDPAALNALPASWQEVLEETRFKAKLKKFLVISGGFWMLIMATLFGVPMIYGFMTDHQKSLSKEHAHRYREVKEMREKVRLVQKYSDHARGALEILKAVSDRLPQGVELNNWNFRREEGVKFSGESADAASVYTFKDRLLETSLQNDEGVEEPLFVAVELIGPSAGRGGKQRFDIECKFVTEEQ